MKKLLILILCALFAFGAFGCSVIKADKDTKPTEGATEAAATEAEATEAVGTETEAPTEPSATDEPTDLVFENGLARPAAFSICSAAFGYQGSFDTGYTDEVPAGEAVGRDFKDFDVSSGYKEGYDLVARDADGRYYYAYGVELQAGSAVRLQSNGAGWEYALTNAEGDASYPAICFEASEPEAPNSGILQVNKLEFAGYEHAERIFHDAFNFSTFAYQLTEIDDSSAAFYPLLAAAVHRDNNDRYIELIYRAHSFCENVQHAEGSFSRGEWYMDAFVRRADSRVYSVLYCFTTIHKGNTVVDWGALNVASQTGAYLFTKDIVNNIAGFTEAVNAKLEEEGSEVRITSDRWDVDEDLHRPVWTLEPNGVSVFVYDGGEGVSVFLPAEEYGMLFREELFSGTGNYTVAFPIEHTSYFTVDGETAGIKISKITDADGYDFTDVVFNGEAYRFEDIHLNSRSDSMYLFARMGGRSFILIMGNDCANSQELYIVEIANNRLYYMGSLRCESDLRGAQNASPAGLNGHMTRQITDPCSFSIGYWTSILGTMACLCPSGLGGDGLPRRLNDWYSANREFTMLCDLDAERISESGDSLGSVTLKQGDKVVFFRTDDNSYADLRLEDEITARVYITPGDENNWMPTVNGVPVNEIFDDVWWL